MKLNILRMTSLMIVVLMLVSAIACANQIDDEDVVDTTVATNDTQSVGENIDVSAETTVTYVDDDITADTNFGGQVINVLYWSDREHEEFVSDTLSGDIVMDALYNRNLTVEQRLGIDLQFEGTPGNASNNAAFVSVLNNSVTSGENAYQMVGTYSITAGSASSKGLLQNLNDYEGMNLQKPWWPVGLMDQANINNKLYFCSGDISANLIYMMYVSFFNKQMITDYNLEDPYTLVEQGKWTIDKQMEMGKDIYIDTNGDGVKSIGDTFGQYAYTLHLDAFLTGSDVIIIQSNGEELRFSDDFYGEKTTAIVDKLHAFFDTDSAYLLTENKDVAQYFRTNLSLFWNDRCRTAINLSANEVSYGILPCPKYDEGQLTYRTVIGNPFSLYGIPVGINEALSENVSTILECMASESYRQVTPALFETAMKYKYTEDDGASKMYDIARETVVFDLGRIFSSTLNSPFSTWEKAVVSGYWASTVKGFKKVAEKSLSNLMKAYE